MVWDFNGSHTLWNENIYNTQRRIRDSYLVKVANGWLEQVAGLGLEIEHRSYSMNDAQAHTPPPMLDQEKPGCGCGRLEKVSGEKK